MWWLSFRDGTAVIMRATSLLHARMLAAIHKIGFVSQFAVAMNSTLNLQR